MEKSLWVDDPCFPSLIGVASLNWAYQHDHKQKFIHTSTLISCLSTHTFKYTSRLSVQFFWQKSSHLLHIFNLAWCELNMSYRGTKCFQFSIIIHYNHSLQCVLPIVLDFSNGAFIDFILPSHCLITRGAWLAQLCNDFTLMGFGQACCLGFHPFPVAIHHIKGSRKRYE